MDDRGPGCEGGNDRSTPSPASTSLYALIFVSVIADVAVVPLLPTLTADYGLSSAETALLLSTTTFGMVVVTLPLGRLADRVGARPLVACAGGFVVLGSHRHGALRQRAANCSRGARCSASPTASSGRRA